MCNGDCYVTMMWLLPAELDYNTVYYFLTFSIFQYTTVYVYRNMCYRQ